MQAFILESNQIEGINVTPHMLVESATPTPLLSNLLSGQMNAWEFLSHQTKITEAELQHAHTLLMVGLLPSQHLGTLRQVHVGISTHGKIEKQFMPPQRVAPALRRWCAEMKTAKRRPFTLHRRLLDIHPFVDGNGRLSRLVWAWDYQRRGIPVQPMLAWMAREAPHLTFTQRRWVYYQALRHRVDDFGPSV